MKRLIATAAVAAMTLAAAPAFAQVTNNSFTLNGTVDGACAMPALGGTFGIDLGVDANGYVNGGNGQFTTVADLGALASGVEVWCNTKSEITVSGTRLVHENYDVNTTGTYGLPGGQFTHTIPMRLADFSFGGANGVSWGTNDLNTGTTLDIEGGAPGTESKESAAHFAGGVSGLLQIWNADRRPIAGDYTAIWTINVSPN